VGLEHPGERLGPEHGAVLVGAAAQKRRDVAGHVARGGIDRAGAGYGHLPVDDRLETAGAQRVSGGKAGPHPLGSDEVGALHAEGAEHVLTEVAVERKPADVLDDLAERGEPVIGVGPLGSRLDVDAQAPSVVLGERRRRAAHTRPPAERRPDQVRGSSHGTDSGGMGQQVSQRGRPKGGLRRDQSVGTQVVGGGRVEVKEPLLPQLHDGDRRDGLGDGGDPKGRVLGDWRARSDVGDPVPMEPRQGSGADHPHGQAGGGPAVEGLTDPALQLELVD
jgi:hypothetical protein